MGCVGAALGASVKAPASGRARSWRQAGARATPATAIQHSTDDPGRTTASPYHTRGAPPKFVTDCVRRSGRVIPCAVNVSPVVWQQVPGVIACVC
jgi:hypothetical protein